MLGCCTKDSVQVHHQSTACRGCGERWLITCPSSQLRTPTRKKVVDAYSADAFALTLRTIGDKQVHHHANKGCMGFSWQLLDDVMSSPIGHPSRRSSSVGIERSQEQERKRPQLRGLEIREQDYSSQDKWKPIWTDAPRAANTCSGVFRL